VMMFFVNCSCFSLTLLMLLDNIVTVVDYGLYVYVFFPLFSVLLLCFSTVIGELKIIV